MNKLKCRSSFSEWLLRNIIGMLMIYLFAVIISFGPLAISLLCILVQLKCYREVDKIGRSFARCSNLNRWSNFFSLYFLFVMDYYYLFQVFQQKFSLLFMSNSMLMFLVNYHRFISFTFYSIGIYFYLKSIDKEKHHSDQLTYLAYIHLEVLVAQQLTSSIKATLFGSVWFILPVSMTICNDIAAYTFGILVGRTKLIEVSPKKTWEGFVGSALTTFLFGFFFSHYLSGFASIVCYSQFDDQCNKSHLFQSTEMRVLNFSVNVYPLQLHSILFSLFISLVGPFGGFFASGFKRAFGLKDFGSSIPGHGGFMDRFDCIPLVMSFTTTYLETFLLSSSSKPYDLFYDYLHLNNEDKQKLFNLINSNDKLSKMIT